MRLGYNTNGFAHHRLEDALVILAELGYQSVALTLDVHDLNPFDPSYPAQLERVHALLEKHRLSCVIETGARFLLDSRRKHQPTLLSPTVEERALRLDFLCRAVDSAAMLGADAVSFWSGTALDGSEEIILNRLVEGCQRLCDHAARLGVRLAFEPEPGMFIDTMDRFDALRRRRLNRPEFGLTLDLGHLHCQGEVPIADRIRSYRALLWNVHIEDMRRGVHDHLMFGEGEIDFPPVLAALTEIGYSGGMHVELSRHSHDAVNTARRALEFLRLVIAIAAPAAPR